MAALVALPLTSVTGLPKSLPSIRNCTVPVGVPEPAVRSHRGREGHGLAEDRRIGQRAERGRGRRDGRGLNLEGPDVHGPIDDPRVAAAALVGGRGRVVGSTGQGIAPRVDGRTAGQERDGLRSGPPLYASRPSPGLVAPRPGCRQCHWSGCRSRRRRPGCTALAEATPAPSMSSAPSSAVLAATIVLYKVVVLPE